MNQIRSPIEIARQITKYGDLASLRAFVTDDYVLILESYVNGIKTHSRSFSLDLLDKMNEEIIKLLEERVEEEKL